MIFSYLSFCCVWNTRRNAAREWNEGEENKEKVREGEVKGEGRINEMKQGKGFMEEREKGSI